jgi:hypothetical protein
MKKFGVFFTAIAVILVLAFLPGCGLFSSANNSSQTSGTPGAPPALKPRPSVIEFTATTTGQNEYYYAILNVDVKNDGADGTILVTASITQGTTTTNREVPVLLPKGARLMVPIVFPLKWKGGDWTPNVKVEVP